jgi:signal transduction histidine kinase
VRDSIYSRKRQWKWLLFAVALLIVLVSLWYTDTLVRKIAAEERARVEIWADAIQRKADLVNYTEDFFEEIYNEERNRVELWALGFKYFLNASLDEDITLYTEIIRRNTTIPVIITDQRNRVKFVANVAFDKDTVPVLEGPLLAEFTQYEPLFNASFGQVTLVYYKESNLFSELRRRLADLTESFFSDVVNNSISVPVIITDSSMSQILFTGNLDSNITADTSALFSLRDQMASAGNQITVRLGDSFKHIYYRESFLLTQLRYFPIAQFGVIGLFLLVSYILFSISRRAEQNQVWAGMAKETAHQLGTPLSSLMAWIEILEMKNVDEGTLREIGKDVSRLETITERFSKIGSEPSLQEEDLAAVLRDSLDYMKIRSSGKILYDLILPDVSLIIPLNKPLFQWVIENMLKNAMDAIEGSGRIWIEVTAVDRQVWVDLGDDGKGIQKSRHKTVFQPGFTTKKRGWGLGLTLSRRIISEYHKGRIFVKQSSPGKGTTFRIILNR